LADAADPWLSAVFSGGPAPPGGVKNVIPRLRPFTSCRPAVAFSGAGDNAVFGASLTISPRFGTLGPGHALHGRIRLFSVTGVPS